MYAPSDNSDFDALVRTIETLQRRMREDFMRPDGGIISVNARRTRTALVEPLLSALAWDITNPAMVIPEYTIGDGVADYALLTTTPDGNTSVIAFIEAKRLGEPLADHRNKILAYATSVGVKYAGLTDGNHWELYEVSKDAPQNNRCLISISLLRKSAFNSAFRLLRLQQANLKAGVHLSTEEAQTFLGQALLAGDSPSVLATLLDYGADLEASLIEVLSDHGIHVGAKETEGWTPLHFATLWATRIERSLYCIEGEPVAVLLRRGADIDARDAEGRTALRIVVERVLKESISRVDEWGGETGLDQIVDLMVRYGADINIRANDGKSAGDLIAEYMPLDYGVFEDSVSAWIFEDELEKSLNLLQHGRLFSQQFWFSKPSVEQVKAEVTRGTAVTATDNYGMTPLHYAVQQYYNTKSIDYLMESGADIMARDRLGRTPLHSVMYPFHSSESQYWHWKTGTVNTLLAYGAGATATDNNGDTPLHHAVACGSGKIGRVFMSLLRPRERAVVPLPGRAFVLPQSQDADIAAQNSLGKTPLHIAVGRDLDDTFLNMLVDSAVINIPDKSGDTPLHWAASRAKTRQLTGISPVWSNANPDMVAKMKRTSIEMLLDNGADIAARNEKGQTPLHIAAMTDNYHGHTPANIEALLNKGADAAVTDNDGRTSYQLAEERGAGEEVLRLLRT